MFEELYVSFSKKSFNPHIKVESIINAATLLHWYTASSTPHQSIIGTQRPPLLTNPSSQKHPSEHVCSQLASMLLAQV